MCQPTIDAVAEDFETADESYDDVAWYGVSIYNRLHKRQNHNSISKNDKQVNSDVPITTTRVSIQIVWCL